jgi:hypothetical protein
MVRNNLEARCCSIQQLSDKIKQKNILTDPTVSRGTGEGEKSNWGHQFNKHTCPTAVAKL